MLAHYTLPEWRVVWQWLPKCQQSSLFGGKGKWRSLGTSVCDADGIFIQTMFCRRAKSNDCRLYSNAKWHFECARPILCARARARSKRKERHLMQLEKWCAENGIKKPHRRNGTWHTRATTLTFRACSTFRMSDGGLFIPQLRTVKWQLRRRRASLRRPDYSEHDVSIILHCMLSVNKLNALYCMHRFLRPMWRLVLARLLLRHLLSSAHESFERLCEQSLWIFNYSLFLVLNYAFGGCVSWCERQCVSKCCTWTESIRHMRTVWKVIKGKWVAQWRLPWRAAARHQVGQTETEAGKKTENACRQRLATARAQQKVAKALQRSANSFFFSNNISPCTDLFRLLTERYKLLHFCSHLHTNTVRVLSLATRKAYPCALMYGAFIFK